MCFGNGRWILAVLLGMVIPTRADISFETIRWDSGLNSWTSRYDVGTVTNSPAGGLQFAFPAAAGPPIPEEDAIVTSDSRFTGNLAAHPGLFVSFDWFASGQPNSVELFFYSALTDTTYLYGGLVPTVGQTPYTVNFSGVGWGAGIDNPNPVDFLTALSSVSTIGILVSHMGSDSGVVYQLDNWKFGNEVPEPGAIALALTVLGASLAVLRRNRSRAPVPDGVTG